MTSSEASIPRQRALVDNRSVRSVEQCGGTRCTACHNHILLGLYTERQPMIQRRVENEGSSSWLTGARPGVSLRKRR